MSFKFVKQLPSPEEIKEMSPVTEEMKKVKETRDRLIQDVITGNSDKFLVIVGPCSADNEEAVCDYTNRLAKVQEKVADRLVLVPRIQQEKDIKECFISLTRKQNQTYLPVSLQSVTCISVPLKKPD